MHNRRSTDRLRDPNQRMPVDQTPRERAEFLAKEIDGDAMAPQAEIADAIEREILRFAGDAGPSAHPDDKAVDDFARAMKAKLARKRDEGRSGWQHCDPERLAEMLCNHLDKGDPVDAANFAMMIWHREGRRTGNRQRALSLAYREMRLDLVNDFITNVLDKTHSSLSAAARIVARRKPS